MSRENVELVAARLREFQAILRPLDSTAPDFVWDMSTFEGWPEDAEYLGREGFGQFFAKWIEAYEEFEQQVETVIDAGEHVVSVIRQRGRPTGSQSWVDTRFGIVFTVSAGNISRARLF